MDNDNAITLNELLISREERAKKQKCLIQTYKANLISFMVNIPGAPKNTYTSRKLHHEGRDILKKKLKESNINILYAASYYRVTGAETFILSHADAIKLKEISIHIENNHPLGRLFDFDVINKDFTFISRTDVGYEKRKCLLCDEDAVICARSRRHSYEQLIKEVYFLTYSYFDKIKSFSNERGGF